MKTYFLISDSEIIESYIEFQMEWNCPFLPRIGETINPSVVAHEVTPERFRAAMSVKAGLEWDRQLAEYPDARELMTEWVIGMSLKVADVTWGIDDDGHHVTIHLMEESVLKGL